MADISRGKTASSSVYPILKLNEAKALAGIAKSAAFTVELTGGDYKTVIIMESSGTPTVTFSAGNGFQGAGSDLAVTLTANTPTAICLDSGYFKNVKGTAKDCVTITPTASTTFTIMELPQ